MVIKHLFFFLEHSGQEVHIIDVCVYVGCVDSINSAFLLSAV